MGALLHEYGGQAAAKQRRGGDNSRWECLKLRWNEVDNLTMKEAIALGRTRYFTGEPCLHGHIVERLVSNRSCIECAAHRKHAWNKAEPDKVNAQKRAWRNANLEKVRKLNLANQKKHRASANARNRRYAEKHREKIRSKNRAWELNNPDKAAAKFARRRASKRHQTPGWVNHERINEIYRIAAVRRRNGEDVHVDHVIPLQSGTVCGLHVHNNLQIIPASVNRSKSNSFLGGT